MIIGISGKKGSGKSTVGRYLEEQGGFLKISFADPLKKICADLFGIPISVLNGSEELKNTPIEIADGTRLIPRKVMQDVGARMREIWPECWVAAWKAQVRATWMQGCRPIVVDDVRYPNEVDAIHRLGGVVVRLTRNPNAGDAHESEIALDGFDRFDAVFDNVILGEQRTCLRALEFCREEGIL